jgi:hypothetical protein
MAGWFGNLASSVAGQIDQVAGHREVSSAAPPEPKSGGGGWGTSARQRSEDEQRAFDIKVLSC